MALKSQWKNSFESKPFYHNALFSRIYKSIQLVVMEENEIEKTASPSEEEKKQKDKPKKEETRKHQIVTIVSLVVIWCAVGSTAGFFAYKFFGPKELVATKTGSLGDVPTEEEVKASLEKGTIVEDYQGNYCGLVNYILNKQAEYAYSLTITRGSTLTLGIEQKIQSYNMRYKEEKFFESVSSGFKTTGGRFYDKGQGIECYDYGSVDRDKWSMVPEKKNISYDEYMQQYGKLFKGKYYCTTSDEAITDNHLVSDVYLTDSETDYESNTDETKHLVNDIAIYYITKDLTLNQAMAKNNSGYQIKLRLDTKADTYYVAQMKTTGGVGIPVFKYTELSFQIDKNLDLVKGTFIDKYDVMGMAATQSLDLYFYHNDESAVFEGIEMPIPTPDDFSDPSTKLVEKD